MDRSTDAVLCYKLSGDVTKADYQTLTPAVEAAIKANGSISLLFDLTDLHWEKASAWGSDLDFGKQFGGNVERMAIVGDKGWEKHLTKLAQPYYAKDAKYFDTDDDAWSWLTS
jgi:hypothetical protein